MKSRLFYVALLLLAFSACKKDSATSNGPNTPKTPSLNAQEQSLAGNWQIDSTANYDAANTFTSHVLPSAQIEPKISFMVAFDCTSCSDMGYYKAAIGSTPGVFNPGVWGAQVTDTLRFGDARPMMIPYRILVLNSTSLNLKKASGSGYSIYYYHRTN